MANERRSLVDKLQEDARTLAGISPAGFDAIIRHLEAAAFRIRVLETLLVECTNDRDRARRDLASLHRHD